MNGSLPGWMIAVALLAHVGAARAQSAAPLPPETRLVVAAGAATATENNFTFDTAQDLIVTLTDLQVPFPLSSATVLVTQAGTLVGSATLAPPATTATLKISAAPGAYVLRVFGAPNASSSVGTFTACVAPQTSPADCIQNASIAGNISTPSAAADPTISTLSVALNVATAGTYTFTFADDQFPAPLATAPNLALLQGSVPVALAIQSGTGIPLSPGTYTLLSIAQADPTAKAGLYGIAVTGPAGVAPLVNSTLPVGLLGPAAETTNPAAQNLTLKITDLAFPAKLAGASAWASAGATNLGTVSTAGSPASFQAPQGPLEVWTFATAGTDAGTYEVDLTSPTTTLLQAGYGASSGSSLAFAYSTPALSGGVSYEAAASDFQFPGALQGLKFAVAQSGAVLQTSAAAGTVNFSPASGAVLLLVNAKTPATGNGLFDVNVQNSAATPSLIFDRTQAVSLSNLFDSQSVVLGTSGDFNVTLTDLKFPAAFADLAVVVSSGGTILGKIFGGGSFPIAATPGTYQLTFVATPAPQQQFGLYAAQISYAPPTITLSATPTTVVAGAASTLSWTTTDATSCTASGGSWTGSPATGSGTVSLSVDATTTYTLTCAGPGGSSMQSVTVTATVAPAGAHSGGGAMGPWLLLMLGSVWLAGVRSTRNPRRVARPEFMAPR